LDNDTIQLVAGLVVILGQTAAIAFWLGKLSTRVTDAEGDINALGQKVTKLDEEACRVYVPRGEFEIVKQHLATKLGALASERRLQDTQNSKEHDSLLDAVKEIRKDIKEVTRG